MKNETVLTAVREHDAAVARGEASACGALAENVARSIGYSDEELGEVFELPAMIILPAAVLGTIGGMVGARIRRLRSM